MRIYFKTPKAKVIHGDCLEVMRKLPDNSISAVITDPPYGLSNTDPKHVVETIVKWASGDREYAPNGVGFMGKEWDAFVPPPAVWDEAFRVLKPGGHLLCFAGTRTVDLMTLSIRLAGFDIRDSLAWLYGSGWPKSMDVSKAIDKASGFVGGEKKNGIASTHTTFGDDNWKGIGQATYEVRELSDAAKEWQGWGTALKPAFEPIVMARKPFPNGSTVAKNVMEYGAGAINIDATRIEFVSEADERESKNKNQHADFGTQPGRNAVYGDYSMVKPENYDAPGRWPANVILDESQAAVLDEQSGITKSTGGRTANISKTSKIYGGGKGLGQDLSPDEVRGDPGKGDIGGASRFFYVAKAPKSERPVVDGVAHSTVKPLAIMRWLIRLVTPEGGIVLDPFAGSGTTAEAAVLEGFQTLAIERDESYLALIQQRLER